MAAIARLALAGCLCLACIAPARGNTIKLGTIAPVSSPWLEVIRDMGDEWQRMSNGAVEVKIYPGGVVGDESDIVRKMRVGQLQAASISIAGLAETVPELRALYMPMLLESNEELDYVLERMRPSLEAALERRGFKALNWGDAGWVHCFAQKPVIRPDDLRAQRLFWWDAGPFMDALKDAGFRPVPLPSTEMHTGLASGLINAFMAPPIAALSFQWFALAPHMTDLNWAPLIGATVITLEKWNSLPEALRPRFAESAAAAGVRITAAVRPLHDVAIAVMRQHGLTVHQVPPDALEEWRQGARAIYPRLIGPMVPAAAVAEVERLRDEYRAQHKQK